MAMPQEEIKKQQEQVAAGGEGPGWKIPSGGWAFFMQYLLHRLDSMESNLRGEITGLRQDTNSRTDGLHQELRSTTRWIIGTVIAAVGVAVALVQWLK